MGRDSNPVLPASLLFLIQAMKRCSILMIYYCKEGEKKLHFVSCSQWLVLQVEHNAVSLVFLPLENKRIYTLAPLTINICPGVGNVAKILYYEAILHTSCTDTTGQ